MLPDHRAARDSWDRWEFQRLQSMHSNLSDKDRILYIGAEEGDLAALCSSWGADVILIEPNNRVWPNIKAIWEANNLKTPLSFAGFAGKEDKGGEIIRGFPEWANGELIGDHAFKTLWEYPELPVITIDTINEKYPLTAITLDVEGAEWEVLRGGEKTMHTTKPKIWLSGHPEFQFAQYNLYLNDLRGWLMHEFGYKETLLDYQHEVHLLYE